MYWPLIFAISIPAAFLLAGAVIVARQRSAKRAAEMKAQERQVHEDALWFQACIAITEHEQALLQCLRQCLYRDGYGRLMVDKALKEARYFFENVVAERVMPETKEDYQVILEGFGNWFDGLDLEALLLSGGEPSTSRRDGVAYERQVASILANLGYGITFTPSSGDQGVDLVAEGSGRRIALQCKNYTGPAGNDAVQQVFAGARFYDANCGVVVAPNGFTVSARQLAANLGVQCLHHDELAKLSETGPRAVPAAI